MQMKPFTLELSEEILDDLFTRVKHSRLPDELDNAGWDYGVPPAYIKELIHY
ncbi:Epoxide hydrolase N terminus [Seinonella peptonophila]|uniref:Epoxide hydrolase N terminus n=1 Tax=Seinonella peptonophila TaxID=112248 RepID=A0A1M4TYG4_9BACL|nr:Epoxide hydrolase N terminus [Seinonella peptonophila]